MPKQIDEIEFTIFDTETTGLNPAGGDRIVELAGLRVRGNQRIAEFDYLVNCGREISPEAYAVNKISPEMLKNAPGIEAVILKFLGFIQGSCLCSYNAQFDLDFLNYELKLMGCPSIEKIVIFDVLAMAKRLLPGLSRYALWFVANKLGVKTAQKHRAFSDVELTWEVFGKLKIICQEKGISDFTNFSNLFAYNPAELESSNEQKAILIQKCITASQILRMRYISSQSAEVTLREVIPKMIKQDNRYRYLVGYCCLKKEELNLIFYNILLI